MLAGKQLKVLFVRMLPHGQQPGKKDADVPLTKAVKRRPDDFRRPSGSPAQKVQSNKNEWNAAAARSTLD